MWLKWMIRGVHWIYGAEKTNEEPDQKSDQKEQQPIETMNEETDEWEAMTATPPGKSPFETFDNIHIVKTGDCLASVALKYYNEVDELRNLNPALETYSDKANLPNGLAMRVSVIIPPNARKQWLDISCVKTFHFIQPGERMSDIAAKYDVGVDEVARLNPQIRESFMMCGKLLKLPERVQKTQADLFYRWPTRPGDVLCVPEERRYF